MTDQTTETARALLYRHGLPEDVIDGALCLHAQELAAVQRRDAAVWGVDTAAGKHVLATADLIDPTRGATPVVPLPSVDQAVLRDRIAAAVQPLLMDTLPKVIAAARAREAADVVLAVLPATTNHDTDTGAELRAEVEQWRATFGRDALPGALRRLERAEADRAAVLREAADAVAALDRRKVGITADTIRDAWEEGRDEAADLLRRMADETAATETCPTPETHNWGCGCPSDEHPSALGTLPAWLHQRFDPRGPDWEQLDEDDRSYWAHQARAVRRAVARGGFKQPAAGARQDGAQQ